MKFRKIDESPKTFILVFETGDELADGLLQFAKEQKLSAASFKAVGALSSVRLGWLNWEGKRYEPSVTLDEQVELLSLIGDVALKDGEPVVHAHAVIGRKDGTAHGGHLLKAVIQQTRTEATVVRNSQVSNPTRPGAPGRPPRRSASIIAKWPQALGRAASLNWSYTPIPSEKFLILSEAHIWSGRRKRVVTSPRSDRTNLNCRRMRSSASGHSPILIFQNEKDGRSKAIDIHGIKQRYDNVKELYAGDLAKTDAVKRVGTGIEFYAGELPHINDNVPVRWRKVREDIEKLAANEPYVPVEKYFEIYRQHIEFDETKARQLSRYLHDLGVFLHFQDDLLLDRTVILQNEWATKAVFRILEDETIKKALGRFTRDDCARLWNDPQYARMDLELLALMQNFDLCYELRDIGPRTWLIPQLLPPAKPAALVDWAPEDLVLRYKYEFLPKGMISRLTVRLHRFVRNPGMAWVTGVLFERDAEPGISPTVVLAQVLEKGDEIELRARGPQAKDLRSVVAAELDALNASFQGLRGKSEHGLLEKVDKRIPCYCKVCSAAAVPEFFDQKTLLKREQELHWKMECPRSYEMVDVLWLLEGIKLDNLPGWAKEEKVTASAAPVAAAPREVRIFLASSAEFSDDRKDFELYFRRLNDERLKRGCYLNIVLWENFLDAMSKTRLQDEYDKAICECDIFVSLFFTRTGKYTEEEFDVAFREFQKKDRPQIFTFFKDAPVSSQSWPEEDFRSLRAFQTKLKGLGHYPTIYTSTDDLKLRFRDQLDKLLEQMRT
jgi:predicted DNA-binding protein with PD1-like motif